jgi:hypothetical protein
MNGIKVDLSFTGLLAFVLDDDFGGINGLDDHGGDTAGHGTDEERFSVLLKERVGGHGTNS